MESREYQHALQQAVSVAASRQAELKQAQAELTSAKAACGTFIQQISQLKVSASLLKEAMCYACAHHHQALTCTLEVIAMLSCCRFSAIAVHVPHSPAGASSKAWQRNLRSPQTCHVLTQHGSLHADVSISAGLCGRGVRTHKGCPGDWAKQRSRSCTGSIRCAAADLQAADG